MDKVKFFLDDAGTIIDFNLLDMQKQDLSWQNRRGLFDLVLNEKLEADTPKHFYIFSRAFDDFVDYFLESIYFKVTLEKLQKGEIGKIVFFCEDMDWFSHLQPKLDDTLHKLKNALGDYIDVVELYLPSYSEFEYEPVKRFHSFGFLTFRLGYYLKFRFFNVNFSKIEKHFFSANNYPRASRMHFYKYLNDNELFDYGNFSFFNFANIPLDENGQFTYDQREDDGGLRKIPSDYKFGAMKFYNEREDNYVNHEIIKGLNLDIIEKSAIEIIFETAYCKDDFVQFSEKTIKGLFSPRPFILHSYPFSLKKLRKLGFKTFDFLFDEEYDNIVDHEQRLYYIFHMVKQISYLDINEIKATLEKNKDVFLHNRYVLNTFYKNEVDIIRKALCS